MTIEKKVSKEWVWISLFFGFICSIGSCSMGKLIGEKISKPTAAYVHDNKIIVEQENGRKYIVEKQQNEVYKVEQIYPKSTVNFHGHR